MSGAGTEDRLVAAYTKRAGRIAVSEGHVVADGTVE